MRPDDSNLQARAPDPASSPAVPLASLAYPALRGHPLARVVRAVGLAAVVFGGLHLGTSLLSFALPLDLRRVALADRDPFLALYLVGLCGSIVIGVLAVVGGVACLRLKPSGRRILTLWAILLLVFATYSIAANSWFMVRAYARTTTPLRGENELLMVLRYAERWVANVFPALVILLILRLPEFHDATNASLRGGALALLPNQNTSR